MNQQFPKEGLNGPNKHYVHFYKKYMPQCIHETTDGISKQRFIAAG